MRLRILLLLTVLTLAATEIAPTQAQTTRRSLCPYTEADYYRPQIAFDFDQSGRLALLNQESEQVTAVLDEGILQMLTEDTVAYGYHIR